jgi:hypothetical protein
VGANAAGTATANAVGLPLGQLSFPATQNASSDANTLDDYEEGTFTPAFSASGATFNYAAQTGIYTKVGRQVSGSIYLELATSGNTLTAQPLSITGLPFAMSGVTAAYFEITWFQSTTSYIKIAGGLASGGTSLAVRGLTAAAVSVSAALNANAALHATNGSSMLLNFNYTTA